jgi:hypothetical protein
MLVVSAPTLAGSYLLSILFDGGNIQPAPAGLFVGTALQFAVTAAPAISSYFVRVTGYGAGAAYDLSGILASPTPVLLQAGGCLDVAECC